MQLPQTAEYALRAMAHIAVNSSEGAIRSRDLSLQTGIPAHYLSKILRKLVLEGLLTSQKGHGGGFVLAKTRDKIHFVDVLTAVGMQIVPDRCAFGWGGCDTTNPCPLHPAWSRFNDAVWRWASETTLADVHQFGDQELAMLRQLRLGPPEP